MTKWLSVGRGVALGFVGWCSAFAFADYSYQGDWNQRNGVTSERNVGDPDAFVYDELVVTQPVVTEVWGNFFLTNVQVTGGDWEVRLGISPGNGGQLLASGTVGLDHLTLLPTGRWSNNEFKMTLAVQSLTLQPGVYFFGIRPVGSGRGRAVASLTDGGDISNPADPNPPPLHSLLNGRSYVNSPGYGSNFADLRTVAGPERWDVSYGLTSVPEPSSLLALAVFAPLVLRRASQRRKMMQE